MFADRIQDRRCEVYWQSGPHQKRGLNSFQALVQGMREGEVATHHLNSVRQADRVRMADQRTDSSTCAQQLRHDLPANVTSRSGHQNHTLHARSPPVWDARPLFMGR